MALDSHHLHAHDPVLGTIIPALHPVDITDNTDKITRDTQRQASVLMPLINRANGWNVLLTQRPETMPTHAGQIAFPGGRVEPGEGALEAALRETHEEVGIEPENILPLGRLDSFNATHEFRITPFVGLVNPEATISPDPREVVSAFEAPLAFFMNPDNHTPRHVPYKGDTLTIYDMPFTEDTGTRRNVWGMTAMILYRLYQRAYLGEFEHPDG